jgi:hypothetical protein
MSVRPPAKPAGTRTACDRALRELRATNASEPRYAKSGRLSVADGEGRLGQCGTRLCERARKRVAELTVPGRSAGGNAEPTPERSTGVGLLMRTRVAAIPPSLRIR